MIQRRGFVIFIFGILLLSILSFGFVSAGWFSDLFNKNKIHSNAIENGVGIDLRVNGEDSSVTSAYKSKLDVSWTTTGDITRCNGYGQYIPLFDKSGLWNDQTLSPSGTKELMAAFASGGNVNDLKYYGVLTINIQCFDSSGNSYTDSVSVSVPQQNSGIVCGNNIAENGEACDGSDLRGNSCYSLGYNSGTLGCENDCNSFDTGNCVSISNPVCGNGILEGGEECDGSNLNGKSCVLEGYASGTLKCDSNCGFDYSGCLEDEAEFWTPWLDRDNPSGKGDYELLSYFVESGQACENPTDVEYRAVNGEKILQTVHSSTTFGFYCLNSENNADGSVYTVSCLDYEVRFKCGGEEEITCEDPDGGLNYNVASTVLVYENGVNTNGMPDYCYGESTSMAGYVSEAYCDGTEIKTKSYKCPNECVDGACIGSFTFNLFPSVATLKDDYSVGEKIELTDPPETGNIISDFNEFANSEYSYTLTNTQNSREGVYSEETFISSAEFDGYIVEFEENSIIAEKTKLNDIAIANEKYVEEKAVYNPVRIYKQWFSIMPEDVEQKVRDYSPELNSNNRIIKNKISNSVEIKKEFTKTFNGVYLNISASEAEEIKKIKGVKNVYPNYKVYATLEDSVPLINADDVWQLDEDGNDCSVSGKECLTGKGIKIAVIDTGVDYTHEDLGGCFGENCKVVGGYDFVNNDNNPMDDHGHGTHCAATAAGNGILKGVAPDVEIYAFKVLDSGGSGYSDDIISAIERSIDLDNDGNIMENENDYVDVISMSLGGGGNPDDPTSITIDNIVNAGIIAVIAAGNSGPGEQTIGSPGTSRNAITVAASDKSDLIADFSSRGPVIWTDENGNEKSIVKPDITAPGVDICAAQSSNKPWNDRLCLDNEHVAISGTSMATPHIAGVVALLKQKNPNWTPEEIKNSLKATAVDLGENVLTQGAGRVDVLESVESEKPLIVYLNEMDYKPSGRIDIYGTAKGNNFQKYEVYYSVKNSEDWNLICESTDEIEEGVLCSNFDTDYLMDGKYEIKLVVYGADGKENEDFNVFNRDIIQIISPSNSGFYRTGESVEIVAKISASGYFLDSVKFSNGGSIQSVEILNQDLGNEEFLLARWNTSGLDAGFYDLDLIFDFKGNSFVEKISNLYFDSSIKEGWPIRVPVESKYFSGLLEPAVSDVDNDGNKEIFVFVAGPSPKVYGFSDDGSILDGWPVELGVNEDILGGNAIPSPSIFDFNGDSFQEIVVRGTHNIFIYSYDGKLIRKIPLEGVGGHPSSLLLSDLNNDGFGEMVVLSLDSYNTQNVVISVISFSGEYLEGWPKLINGTMPIAFTTGNPSPSIGNFDDDPEKEIVVAGGSGGLLVFNLDGSILFEVSSDALGWALASPSVGDVDNDGYDEIVLGAIGGNKGVYVVDNDGSILDGWPKAFGEAVYSSASLLDIEGDGFLEIFVSSYYSQKGNFYLFNYLGESLEGWPIKNLGFFGIRSPLIADFSGSSSKEVFGIAGIFAGGDGNSVLYSWDLSGVPPSKNFDSFVSFGSPVISDIDNDGFADLVIGRSCIDCTENTIFVFNLDTPYDENSLKWPMYQHDPQRTGNYNLNNLNQTMPPIEKPQSKIVNNNNESVSGNLLMILQKKSGDYWLNETIVTNQSITIPANDLIKLDIGENYGWNLKNVSASSSGDYRVYVLFETSDGQKFETNWEFRVE